MLIYANSLVFEPVGGPDKIIKLDLIDAMIQGANPDVSDADSEQIERSACPTCGSCSGMFTANSMNCLTEALGLALPGNGSLLATHGDVTTRAAGRPGRGCARRVIHPMGRVVPLGTTARPIVPRSLPNQMERVALSKTM